MVFLEAALHHLPVVSYRHGGVPEAVVDGSTGLLAEEGNVGELSEKIRVLLTDDDLARVMGRAGYQRVVADFDVRERTRDLERVYESVTGAGA